MRRASRGSVNRPAIPFQGGEDRPYVWAMVTGDALEGTHDHSTTEPAVREILGSLRLPSTGLHWIESYSHSAWMTDEVVVRYRIIGPTGRLTHEAAVAACLPAGALYPEVIASGCSDRDDWLVTARVPGVSLLEAWPGMSRPERELATHELAMAVKALHGAPAQHLRPPCLFRGAPVVPRSTFIETLKTLVMRAAGGRDDADVSARVFELLDEHEPLINDVPNVMAHHDLNFGQCIWRDGHLVGLVDLEMSHANTADWDLPVLLGMCAEPRHGASTALEPALDVEDFVDVPRWFRDAYPAPFTQPSLIRRLRIYELIYRLASFTDTPDPARMLDVLEHGTRYEHLVPA